MNVSQRLGIATGDPYSLRCSNGSYITDVNINSKDWVRGMSVTCNNNKVLGPVGYEIGRAQSVKSPKGFTGYAGAASGDFFNSITLVDTNNKPLTKIGEAGGGVLPSWKCPKGQLITGVLGNSTNNGITTKFTCSPVKNYQPLYIGIGIFVLLLLTVIVVSIVIINARKKKVSKSTPI